MMTRKEMYQQAIKKVSASPDAIRWDLLNAACIQALMPMRTELMVARSMIRLLAKGEGIDLDAPQQIDPVLESEFNKGDWEV